MGKGILLDFSTVLLLKAEKSLDLLQAILVYHARSVDPRLTVPVDINIYRA